MTLQPIFAELEIHQFSSLFQGRRLNLDPGFQRKSVWTTTDRIRLIQSIVAGYPLPSVFLYRRDQKGRVVYDVIDGKQRLETIFMFTKLGRFKRAWFETKLDLENGPLWYDWPTLRRHFPHVRAQFESYKIPTVEVSGELSQIVDLFVRINSTGKRLTSGERRHAKFYKSPFLKEADKLVAKYHKYLREQRILSPAQLDRMKGTELFSELLMSINQAGPINKKTALDRAIRNDSVNGNTLSRISREFIATANEMKRMFPDLKQTRFHNSVEYYSLFLLVWEMRSENFVLADRRRNRVAFELLRKLSTGVDELRDQLKRATIRRPPQRLYSDYLLTVQGDTDSSASRERRREILKGLLFSLYERKDEKRAFSAEQRRIIWNSDEKKLCSRCHKPLTWADFTIDHIVAHTRGGKTSLRNAQIMCRRCNSSKGARPGRIRRALAA